MSHIIAILLWALAATGATDACNTVAVTADAEAAVCMAPPPAEPDTSTVKKTIDARPHTRRISNGF